MLRLNTVPAKVCTDADDLRFGVLLICVELTLSFLRHNCFKVSHAYVDFSCGLQIARWNLALSKAAR